MTKDCTFGPDLEFSLLLGKTIAAIQREEDELIFALATGERYALHHHQDCCETVTLEDVSGDLEDLINTPILLAEEVDNSDPPPGKTPIEYGSETWTYYKLRTIKGSVDIRFYGGSNGYYSESVDFHKVS